MLESFDQYHIIDKINRIPKLLIIEIILIIFIVNLVFSMIYCNIYKKDPTSFKNIHNLESNESISFSDFLYFSHTTFYSLGYDIIPQSKIAKLICVIHLKISFIIMAIYIGRILK